MILEVEAVDTFYGETQALFGASLAVERGKVFALLGPNGAGKTTMLRSILGLTRPRRGAIRFDGREVTHSPTHEIARGGIGWVPDDRGCVRRFRWRAISALRRSAPGSVAGPSRRLAKSFRRSNI
jgi:ABC-type branched-subunit amino acid transport system ATPase component